MALLSGGAVLLGAVGRYLPWGRVSAILDIINAFLPVLEGMLTVAVLAMLVTRVRMRLTLAFATAAWIAGGVPLVREFTRPIATGRVDLVEFDRGGFVTAQHAKSLRLVQFNMLVNNSDPQAALALLLSSGTDVVVIPEPRQALRNPEFGRQFPYLTPCARPCQIIVASRLRPLSAWSETLPAPKGEAERVGGRGLELAFMTFGDPALPLTVVGVHYTLPIPPWAHGWQRAALVRRLARIDRRRLVLSGDFNVTPWQGFMRQQDALLQPLTRVTRAVPTYPTSYFGKGRLVPILPIDHVYVGPGLCPGTPVRLGSGGSDHDAVRVDIAKGPC